MLKIEAQTKCLIGHMNKCSNSDLILIRKKLFTNVSAVSKAYVLMLQCTCHCIRIFLKVQNLP